MLFISVCVVDDKNSSVNFYVRLGYILQTCDWQPCWRPRDIRQRPNSWQAWRREAVINGCRVMEALNLEPQPEFCFGSTNGLHVQFLPIL